MVGDPFVVGSEGVGLAVNADFRFGVQSGNQDPPGMIGPGSDGKSVGEWLSGRGFSSVRVDVVDSSRNVNSQFEVLKQERGGKERNITEKI